MTVGSGPDETRSPDELAERRPDASPIDALREVMSRLRDPSGGCAWDLAQTFSTVAPYTLEEAYEVVDAISRDDPDDLREELGDLLFQVVFHARMAEEAGLFDFDDVSETITRKMIRRHPHVFAEQRFASDAERQKAWEEAKAAERAARARRRDRRARESSPGLTGEAGEAGETGDATGASQATADEPSLSALDGVALGLPALLRADKVQRRAALSGFDWTDTAPVRDKVAEELAEVEEAAAAEDTDALEDEIGDLLFASVNLARHHGVDGEAALRRATAKFERRFRRVEGLAAATDVSLQQLDPVELDALWNQAKAEERH